MRHFFYVALPSDFVRVRTKLVGFLLHPIARSATWRRLIAQNEMGFYSKYSVPWLLARNRFAGTACLAACRFLRKLTAIDNLESVTDYFILLKVSLRFYVSLNSLFAVTCGENSGRFHNKKGARQGAFFLRNLLSIFRIISDAHGHDDVTIPAAFI